MNVQRLTESDRDRFNSFVAGSKYADVLQSWEWGEIKKATGWRPERVLIEDQGNPVAAFSMLLNQSSRAIPPIAYAPRGPVGKFDEPSVVGALIDAIREVAGDAFLFVCDPPVEGGSEEAAALTQHLKATSAGGFGGLQPKAVMVLHLDGSPEEIMAGFKSKWRYNIRLAKKKGVEIRAGQREDVNVFHDLLVETAVRDGFTVRGVDYFEALWDHLTPAKMLKMFLAHYEGNPIAGVMLFCLGGRVVYTYGASSNQHRKVMPNHLIQWHSIRWAMENGYDVYDFRGVSPVKGGQPVDDSIAGLNRFKEGFGARYVEYVGQLELPLRKGWHTLWRTAGPLAMKLRRSSSPRVGGITAE